MVGLASASEGIHYTTDSGFEVIDTSGGDAPNDGNPFPDDNTLELPDVTLSAAGSSTVKITQRTGDFTNLTEIDAGPAGITVNPDDKQAVVVESGFDDLDFRSIVFDATAGDDPDLVYDASGSASLTIQGTGLSEGRTVEALDGDSGETLDSADVDASGDLTFTALDSGSHDVNLEDTATRPDDGGGSDDDEDADTTSPAADAGADRTATVGEQVTFDAGNSTDNEGIDTYQWSFQGGYRTGETVTRTFDDPGEYTVELSVTDGNFNTDTDTVEVTVEAATTTTSTVEETTAAPGTTVSGELTTVQRTDATRQTEFPQQTDSGQQTATDRTGDDRQTATAGSGDSQGTTAPSTATTAETGTATAATDSTTASGPGFTAGLTVVAILAVALVVARRREYTGRRKP